MTFTMFVIESEEEDEFIREHQRYANVLEEEEFESDGEGLEGGTNEVPAGEEEPYSEPLPFCWSDNFFHFI